MGNNLHPEAGVHKAGSEVSLDSGKISAKVYRYTKRLRVDKPRPSKVKCSVFRTS